MKLYLPLGSKATEAEKEEWIRNVEALTNSFQQKNLHSITKYPFEIDSYLVMKERSNYRDFITEMWQEHYDQAEKLFLNNSKNILQDDLLRYAFFLSAGGIWQKIQLPYLESKWDEKELKKLLIEDTVFNPDITSAKYQSSETLINHLTHLTKFQEKAKVKISDIKPELENKFFENICKSLKEDGICIIGTPNITASKYASPGNREGHINLKSYQDLRKILSKFFKNGFLFSMNDEVVHTGYYPMAHYLILVGIK